MLKKESLYLSTQGLFNTFLTLLLLSLEGGLQHGQTAETLFWDRDKSKDELDAMMRHVLEEDWAQVAWRAMANLEKKLEEKS